MLFEFVQFENVPMSTSRNLALGQGKNKGVVMELDPSPLKGKVSRNKPGAEFLLQQGEGELIGSHNSQRDYQQALRSFTIQKTAKADKVNRVRIKRLLPQLIKSGWKKTENSDGSVTYTRPTEGEFNLRGINDKR